MSKWLSGKTSAQKFIIDLRKWPLPQDLIGNGVVMQRLSCSGGLAKGVGKVLQAWGVTPQDGVEVQKGRRTQKEFESTRK